MKTSIRTRTIICVLSLISTTMIHSQVPLYNSYPSAQAVIFLDFDGHTVNGTSWNYNGPIVCGASGLDNSQINEVFNRVAEDYRPFNINITTDSTKYWAAPATKRTRVILTVSSSWYGAAGGVSFVGSFSWGDNNPCFVFSQLLNFNVKYISEAVAHEAGHTLGLYHQSSYDASCNKLSDYYSGQGSGEIGWAPIMGVGYYRNFTLWHNGPNSYGCNSTQSDLDIITSATNGFGYRTDDHNSSFDAATVASFLNDEFNINGVVEKNTDQDMFTFTLSATGRFQLDAIPYNVGTGDAGSDLDMQVTLYNNSQTVLNVFNPGMLLRSVIDTTLNAGVYFLKVEGRGNMYAPAYASLGSYALTGHASPGTVLPLRKLELRGLANGDNRQLNWTIDATEDVMQQSLEVSTDGRTFQQLTLLSKEDRTYIYRPVNSASAKYRLNVEFNDGHRYYSNIVTIGSNVFSSGPRVEGTLIRSSTIVVNSPGNYEYAIIDMNGRLLKQGKLVSGITTIDAGNIIAGMYLVRFWDNEQQWIDKFVRE